LRVWVQDVKYQFAMALRAVGVALAAVGFASVLGSEAQQDADIRSYALVGTIIVVLVVAQWLTRLPPSATLVEVLRPFERDIVFVARERAGPDTEQLELLIARITALAAVRIRQGVNPPGDHRGWLRALLRLAESDQT
jgi:hypothetical protein